jgi:hypothetical protein
MTGNYRLVVVSDLAEPRPRQMGDPGLSEPCCWTIIPPRESRHVEVIISAKPGSILVIDQKSVREQKIASGARFLNMEVSPDMKSIACFGADGGLSVLGVDGFRVGVEFSTNSTIPPLDIAWFDHFCN